MRFWSWEIKRRKPIEIRFSGFFFSWGYSGNYSLIVVTELSKSAPIFFPERNLSKLSIKKKSETLTPLPRRRCQYCFATVSTPTSSHSGIREKRIHRLRGSVSDPVPDPGGQKWEKLGNFMFWSAGFFCSMDVLYGGLGIDPQKSYESSCFFKCWMFSFEGWKLLLQFGRPLWRPRISKLQFFIIKILHLFQL